MDSPAAKSSCCSYVPSLSIGNPRGSIIDIDGIKAYVALPSSHPLSTLREPHKRVIIFLGEAHGIFFPHAQLLADIFAEQLSCPVIAPDLLNGGGMPMVEPVGWDDEKEMDVFLLKYHPESVDPVLKRVLAWVGAELKVKSLGAIGYCFGGRYVLRLLGWGAVDAGVVNHPSFFTMDEVEDLGRAKPVITFGVEGMQMEVKPPLAVFAAEVDSYFPPEKRREMEDRLTRNGSNWTCTTYSGVGHGFTIRPDLKSKAGLVAWQGAVKGAVTWFDQYLSKD